VCHMLFADDVRIFIPTSETAFSELKNCIGLYETTSGSKLNLQKSVITSIALDTIPSWIRSTGCCILKEGETQKYLGAPFGNNLSSAAVQNFCLDKLAKRIATLKPRNISFPSRVQLIKQVLLAMPVYHMMYTYMPKKSIKKIQRMCREFLWGFNKNGGRKVPLIAWARITKLRKHGGLGINDIKVQATALMARWPIKLINDSNSTWGKLFTANLNSLAWKEKKKIGRLGYSFVDKIIFSKPSGLLHKEHMESMGRIKKIPYV
jgi:hypothetical protein